MAARTIDGSTTRTARQHTARRLAAGRAAGLPHGTEPDDDDTAAGSGWSIVALLANGTAEPCGTFDTFGAAADVAADMARLARSAPVYGPHGTLLSWRVVVVPDYAAADMLAV